MRTLCILFLWCLTLQSVFAAESNVTITVDGTTYSNITFGTVTPATVKVFNSSGIAVLPLSKLSPELQQRFGYDPKKAAESIAQQAKIRAKQLETAQKQDRLKEELNNAKGIDTTVIQVLPGGLLCSDVAYGVGLGNYRTGYNVVHEQIFLTDCDVEGVTDGTIVDARVVEDGTYRYVSVSGASKTIKKYRCLTYKYYTH